METQEQGNTYVGRVKWFNNKVGYGFITVTDGEKTGTDVFVNHRKIVTEPEDQYKYLVEGEYVEFTFQPAETDSKHEYQAGQVRGIKGGKLMCETRLQVRKTRISYKENSKGDVNVQEQKQEVIGEDVEKSEPVKKPRSRAPPKKNDEGSDEKMVKNVGKRNTAKK